MCVCVCARKKASRRRKREKAPGHTREKKKRSSSSLEVPSKGECSGLCGGKVVPVEESVKKVAVVTRERERKLSAEEEEKSGSLLTATEKRHKKGKNCVESAISVSFSV